MLKVPKWQLRCPAISWLGAVRKEGKLASVWKCRSVLHGTLRREKKNKWTILSTGDGPNCFLDIHFQHEYIPPTIIKIKKKLTIQIYTVKVMFRLHDIYSFMLDSMVTLFILSKRSHYWLWANSTCHCVFFSSAPLQMSNTMTKCVLIIVFPCWANISFFIIKSPHDILCYNAIYLVLVIT
jgi:hypothetical protein